MSRGKYKTRKENSDSLQLASDLKQARAQLDQELERLHETKRRRAETAELKQALDEALTQRNNACAPQLEQIAADLDLVSLALRDLQALCRSVDRHHDRVFGWVVQQIGAEALIAVVGGDRIVVSEGVAASKVDVAGTVAIQQARGLRERSRLKFTAEKKQTLAQAFASAAGVEYPSGSQQDEDGGWTAVSRIVKKDVAAEFALQFPPPWLATSPDPLHIASRVLGAAPVAAELTVDPAATVAAVSELSVGTAALRDATAAAGLEAVAAAFSTNIQSQLHLAAESSIRSSRTGSPAYPAPGDAAALQAWYSAAALGQWARHRNTNDTAISRAAVAAAAATPFWLPPGHTMAYLDSEPLSGEDIDAMRMPFAQVLVTFAEPARLPPLDSGAVPAHDPRLAWIDYVTGIDNRDIRSREMLIAGTNELKEPLLPLWDVIAARGAHIEAVLLLADAHGRLEDLFGWCIAIPSTSPGAALGRWLVPASLASTNYANLVINAAAVAAWADWHRPGQARALSERQEQPLNTAAAKASTDRLDERVHVLNVTATTPAKNSAACGEPTGRTTAPHPRRGHWRRQHYGPARSSIRRIRIAPVMVNAGRVGAERPRIYRLPTPQIEDMHTGAGKPESL